MTRRCTAALVTLFAGLLSLGSASVVSAREPVLAPQNISATSGVMHRVCTSPEELFMLCYQQQPGGMWTTEELQADNTWTVVGIQAAPPILVDANEIAR